METEARNRDDSPRRPQQGGRGKHLVQPSWKSKPRESALPYPPVSPPSSSSPDYEGGSSIQGAPDYKPRVPGTFGTFQSPVTQQSKPIPLPNGHSLNEVAVRTPDSPAGREGRDGPKRDDQMLGRGRRDKNTGNSNSHTRQTHRPQNDIGRAVDTPRHSSLSCLDSLLSPISEEEETEEEEEDVDKGVHVPSKAVDWTRRGGEGGLRGLSQPRGSLLKISDISSDTLLQRVRNRYQDYGSIERIIRQGRCIWIRYSCPEEALRALNSPEAVCGPEVRVELICTFEDMKTLRETAGQEAEPYIANHIKSAHTELDEQLSYGDINTISPPYPTATSIYQPGRGRGKGGKPQGTKANLPTLREGGEQDNTFFRPRHRRTTGMEHLWDSHKATL